MTILLNKPFSPCVKKLTEYLNQVNDSGWYTNFGPLHEKLTKRLEEYLGVSNLLLVSNGTLAIQVACKVLGIENVITTPYSFAATSSSLLWQGVEITYADINPKSLNICANEVKKVISEGDGYDGLVATHVYGNACEVKVLSDICQKANLKVIYDAAHAFGIKYDGKSILSFGDASTLSFHATKLFHTVEGGAIVFKNKDDFLKARDLINFGISPNGKFAEPGINAKLNEYQCAVGLTNLEHIDSILEKRKALFNLYYDSLNGYVELPMWNKSSSANGAYMAILLKNRAERDEVKNNLHNQGIQCREYFSPSLNKVYKPNVSMPVSESTSDTVLCLPLHYYLTKSEVKNTCDAIKASLK